ncbi:MAG: hypothetical protein ACTH0H_11005 [Brachybacterium sp.]
MTPFWGAQPDLLRELGSAMSSNSSRLSELFTTLDGSVLQQENWTGSDAEAFRAIYTGTVRPAVASLTSELSARSALLASEADQQDAASASDGSGAQHSVVLSGIGALNETGSGFPRTGLKASATLGFWDHRGDERSARRGEGRENTPRNDGDGTYDPDADNPNSQYSTPGPAPTVRGENGLGEGVPGTQSGAPEPPAWTPPADGAGEHNSEFAGPIDHSVHSLAREGADMKRGDWPNASEHLDHFLDNSGADYDADVDSLISDQPDFAQKAQERRHQAGYDAVAQAQADGATGPITYPLSTAWGGHTADGDWFYASGSFNYNQTGTVTAHPPDAEHPQWRYEVDAQVNFRDRYNWDGGKATAIGPFTVTDERLAALHRGGIAREYNLVGRSSSQHSEGSVS